MGNSISNCETYFAPFCEINFFLKNGLTHAGNEYYIKLRRSLYLWRGRLSASVTKVPFGKKGLQIRVAEICS